MNRLPRIKRAAVTSLATFALSATVTIACGDGKDGEPTPAHIAEIAKRLQSYRPRSRQDPLFSGLLAA